MITEEPLRKVDAYRNCVVFGDRYDPTLEDINGFLNELENDFIVFSDH
jgi:hypothetical protein